MGAEFEPPLAEIVKKKRGRRFALVRRGVDPGQVDAFLVAIASSIEALEKELLELRSTADDPLEDPDPRAPLHSPEGNGSDGSSKRMARLAAVGVGDVDRMLAETKAAAATILADARSESERITRDAQGVAGRSVAEARAFLNQVEEAAGRVLFGVAERRRQMMGELRTIQERVLTMGKDLDLLLHPEGRRVDVPDSAVSAEARAGS